MGKSDTCETSIRSRESGTKADAESALAELHELSPVEAVGLLTGIVEIHIQDMRDPEAGLNDPNVRVFRTAAGSSAAKPDCARRWSEGPAGNRINLTANSTASSAGAVMLPNSTTAPAMRPAGGAVAGLPGHSWPGSQITPRSLRPSATVAVTATAKASVRATGMPRQ